MPGPTTDATRPGPAAMLAASAGLGRVWAALFFVMAFATGAPLSLLTPLGQVGDEPAHALRVASLLHGQWVGRRAPALIGGGEMRVMAGLDGDVALFQVQSVPGWPPLDAARLANAREQAWTGTLTFFQVPSTAIYMPAFYAPAAAGMALAKLLGAGPFAALHAARLANLICFALAGVAALLWARRGHALMFCTLTLPMTLNLAASVNQDGLLLAACVLAAALLSRGDRPGPPRGAAYWSAALLLACIIAVKPPYAPLLAGLLLPLPPLREWPRLRGGLPQRVCVAVLAVAPALFWSALVAAVAFTPFDRPLYEAGPLWPGPRPAPFIGTDPSAQLQVLMANPALPVTLAFEGVARDLDGLLLSAVGVLGWLAILLPPGLYKLWALALGSALLHDVVAPRRPGALAGFAVLAAAAALYIVTVYTGQYLSWTTVGSATVEGVQGRYMLPLIPLLAAFLPGLGLPGGHVLRLALMLLPIAAAATGVVVLPLLTVGAFYL